MVGLLLLRHLLVELLFQGIIGLRTTDQADANLVPQAHLIVVAQPRVHVHIGFARALVLMRILPVAITQGHRLVQI